MIYIIMMMCPMFGNVEDPQIALSSKFVMVTILLLLKIVLIFIQLYYINLSIHSCTTSESFIWKVWKKKKNLLGCVCQFRMQYKHAVYYHQYNKYCLKKSKSMSWRVIYLFNFPFLKRKNVHVAMRIFPPVFSRHMFITSKYQL